MLKKSIAAILFIFLICITLTACGRAEEDLKTIDELLTEIPDEEILVYVGEHDISEEAALVKSEAEKVGAEYTIAIVDNEGISVPFSEDIFTVEYGKTYTITLTVTLGGLTRTKTVTLRAAKNFTITFALNGGTEAGSISYQQTVVEEDDAALPEAPERTNYIFSGWSPEPVLNDITEDATYTAQWTPTYLITFTPNGGSAVTAIRVYSGENRNMPASTREGYYFAGWYKDNGTFANEFTTAALNADTIVYAQWVEMLGAPTYNGVVIPEEPGSPNTYKFVFPASSGDLHMELFAVGSPQSKNYTYVFGEITGGGLGVTVFDGETVKGVINILLEATD